MENVTIKDVAREAGVSITTVSLILNGKAKNISIETIRRVNEVSARLNFHRNSFACSLKKKESKMLGFIVPDLENTYYSRVANLISTLASEKGYITIIASSNNDFQKEMNYIIEMSVRRVDALLLFPSTASLKEDNLKQLQEVVKASHLKVVFFDRLAGLPNCSAIINDDAIGASLATDYLINKGYKRIACITGPENLSSSVERLEGYKLSLQKHNIKFDEKLIYTGDYRFDLAKELAKKILEEKTADAIFAFNDVSAYAIYDSVDELGLKVGKDVAVVGYDDNPFSSLITPKLSSVRQNVEEMCKVALDHLTNDKNIEIVKIKPSMVERDSVV